MDAGRIPVIKISQWLRTWELRTQPKSGDLPTPPKHFFVASIKIDVLRRLAGVPHRDIKLRKKAHPAPGYQRLLEENRSRKISRYIHYGYPLSTQGGLIPSEHTDLINPGWLPTAILINLVPSSEERQRGSKKLSVPKGLQVSIVSEGGRNYLQYPKSAESERTWNKTSKDALRPIEVIDGQHRLFALSEDETLDGSYEVPVVIFDNLALSWQAYLFWVINVEPKKINTSLAFDLYPELRDQDWLERGESIKVYQEHRAQELTEALWRQKGSPWEDRIELLGRRIDGHVSNAAFIRSLTASFIRNWGKEHRIGGLFGSMDKHGESYVLKWDRAQQAAFLITIWKRIEIATKKSNADWVNACVTSYKAYKKHAKPEQNPHNLHPAFAGPFSLLGTDQGVRAVSVVYNALLQVVYEDLDLESWLGDYVPEAIDQSYVQRYVAELEKNKAIIKFIDGVSKCIVDDGLDWRTSSDPSLDEDEQKYQAAYRGSGGYTLLQQEMLKFLTKSSNEQVRKAAKQVVNLVEKE